MLTFRITNRSIAPLLVGVLLFAQMAVTGYASPIMLNGSADRPGDMGDVAATQSEAMETRLGGMDSDLPNLCFGPLATSRSAAH